MHESMTYQDRVREQDAARERRLSAAWNALRSAGRSVEVPDYSQARTASEAEWVRLGGSVETFRALADPDRDPAEQTKALDGFLSSLGAAPFREVDSREESKPDELDPARSKNLAAMGLNPALAEARTATEAGAALAMPGGELYEPVTVGQSVRFLLGQTTYRGTVKSVNTAARTVVIDGENGQTFSVEFANVFDPSSGARGI